SLGYLEILFEQETALSRSELEFKRGIGLCLGRFQRDLDQLADIAYGPTNQIAGEDRGQDRAETAAGPNAEESRSARRAARPLIGRLGHSALLLQELLKGCVVGGLLATIAEQDGVCYLSLRLINGLSRLLGLLRLLLERECLLLWATTCGSTAEHRA